MKALGRKSIASVLKVLLDVSWWLLMMAGIFLFVAIITGIGDPSKIRVDLFTPFSIERPVYEITASHFDAESLWIGEAVGEVKFHTSSRPVVVIYLACFAVWWGVFAAILLQLRRIFRSMAAGHPFVRENIGRIRFIGLVAIGGEVGKTLAEIASTAYVKGHFIFDGLKPVYDFRLGFELFLGLTLLVLAEVFRIGVEMREEQELTV